MMVTTQRMQQLYEKQIRFLPVSERLRLVKLVIDGLSENVDQWTAEENDWRALSLNSFQQDWDNPEDAVYDNWREVYGVPAG
jgi:hypothetical protein